MNIIEERRKIEQIPEYDEDGRIKYYKIPNYTIRKEFITCSERKFLRILIDIVKELNKKLHIKNIHIQISTQVAINRIIDINNKRIRELYNEIDNKSIDYVLFDLNSGRILCCIELNGIEHQENQERKQRDILIRKMFEDTVKYIEIERNDNYNSDELYELIKKYIL